MSTKQVTVEQRSCDFCGKPMDAAVGGVDIGVSLPTPEGAEENRRVGVRVVVADFDLHERCQWEIIAEAARQVGTRKPRGRAAHKGEAPVGDNPGVADTEVPATE